MGLAASSGLWSSHTAGGGEIQKVKAESLRTRCWAEAGQDATEARECPFHQPPIYPLLLWSRRSLPCQRSVS